MRFTNWESIHSLRRDDILERFTDWSEELTAIIESRIFSGGFKQVIDILSAFGDEPVTRLTLSELDDQLTLCSQYRFTFSETAAEIRRYQKRVKSYFDIWMAEKRIRAKKDILKDHQIEIDAGRANKSFYDKVTGSEVSDRLMVDNETQYRVWMDFLSHIEGAATFLENLVADIDQRSMILMSLRKIV